MRKLKIFALAVVLFFSPLQKLNAQSENPDDNQPQPGEAFPTYFARITRGGTFPGIYLDAPESVQNKFLHRIKKGTWVGDENQTVKQLESEGIDLWGNWYQENVPYKLLFPTHESLALFSAELGKLLQTLQFFMG